MLSLQTQEHTIPKEIILCVYIAVKVTEALYWSISMHEIAIKDFLFVYYLCPHKEHSSLLSSEGQAC